MKWLLEIWNGLWALQAAFCVVFLIDHLRSTAEREHLTWRRWLIRTPLGVALAIGTAVTCFAIFISRGAIWYWRMFMGGDSARLFEISVPLIVSALIGSAGLLCILRVVSQPRGRAPFYWAVGVSVAYVAAYLAAIYSSGP